MPIELPRGLPFSVDTWTASSNSKRHHFLTHAHKDHSSGICTHFAYPIYTTHLTKSLLLQQYPWLDHSLFVLIEVGHSVTLEDPDGAFTVTAFDANHCPGAVMFLFEGNFGNILHTGDCRLTPECLQKLPEKYVGKKGKQPFCQLDYVFLDCTFGKFSIKMPSKHNAIQQVINCIWKHPNTPLVYLTCDLLGQEEVLVNVSKIFGAKIYIDKAGNPESFMHLTLTAPEIISQDPTSRFQLLDGFPRLHERAQARISDARANSQPVPLIIRPSAQWYALEEERLEADHQRRLRINEAVKDLYGVWHVCYSMHSSREELEWALQLLAPKRVVSTTPNCWAMELDYVKRNCFSPVSSDDPLWRLVDISVKDSIQISSETQLQTVDESPPRKRPLVTLFGRARVGLPGSTPPQEMTKSVNPEGSQSLRTCEREHETSPVHNVEASGIKGGQRNSVEKKESKVHVVSSDTERSHSLRKDKKGQKTSPLHNEEGAIELKSNSIWVSGNGGGHATLEGKEENKAHIVPSNSFSENMRKLYRSKNVPVPRPLPSLVQLRNATKKYRRM